MKYKRPGSCLAFSCLVSQGGNQSQSLLVVVFVRRELASPDLVDNGLSKQQFLIVALLILYWTAVVQGRVE
jgi:hypothetical protein